MVRIEHNGSKSFSAEPAQENAIPKPFRILKRLSKIKSILKRELKRDPHSWCWGDARQSVRRASDVS